MFRKKELTEMSIQQAAFLKKIHLRNHIILCVQIALLVLFFGLWELAARQKWIDPFIFSQPSRMFSAMIQMLQDGTLIKHTGITLWETVVGFLLGTTLGTLIAILLWWSDFISDVMEPYLVILNSLPKTALAPIIIVWLGNNMTSIIATALMTSIIVTIMTVLGGFLEIDEDKIKLIRTFGGTKKQILTKVVLPASVPTIVNALKINVGLSFVGVIVGEFLVASAGLGYLIVYGSQIFKLDWVMLSVVLLAIMAALMYKSIVLLEKKILKWRE
ncbi:MAG: ABC transporter permease [Epulopiscium sp.]|jgi:NitT/TauT family transport system permease protein|nr:ABC transporter permease [Candidatus Epulonipiscium sp.]